MSDELLKVVCSQCDGKMKVRPTGSAVVCPHCKVKLRIHSDLQEGARLNPIAESQSKPSVLSTTQAGSNSAASAGPTVSRKAFVLLASYASVVTIGFLWLLFGSSHQLESLPDLRTLGDEELQFVGYATALPAGHTLTLNETRRFGDIEVTPLRVTREPIEYQHYEDETAVRPASEPVVKLWMKFKNVSDDVSFPPYDSVLMSKRVEESGVMRSNTFLTAKDGPRTTDSIVMNYDHPADSEWNLAECPQSALPPGAQSTTFVATSEEGATKVVDGQLVWRLQFRKGINRSSRRGVTTLVDVVFSADDIVADSAKLN